MRPDFWLLLHAPAVVADERIRSRPNERDAAFDIPAYDAGNRFGMEIARANSVRCIDTDAHAVASYLEPLLEDVAILVRSRQDPAQRRHA